MRRLQPLLALALFAVVFGLWWGSRPSDDGAALRPAPALDVQPANVTPSAPVLPEPVESRATVQNLADEPAADAGLPMCTLLGRVVDEAGQPLGDVLVSASAFRTWRAGVDVPRLEGRYDMRGFEVRTDATGAFRIETPVPTAEVVAVRVFPDRFHDSWVTRLGSVSSCDGPLLVEGPRDLGEIRLARAGAIRGLVTDEAGAPLSDVELSTGPSTSHTYSRGAHTAVDGTYLIPHAVVGTYGVKTKLEGYLNEFQTPITVEAGRDTLGVDFVLRAAPSIEGTVVDEHGNPVEGAKLWGWPLSSGAGAGSKSGADGCFVVHLPHEAAYRFSVERDGYVTWDEESSDHTSFAPGARDVRIVLRSLARTRFLVVDAKTGEPIERFGFGILENNGSRSTRGVWTEKRPPRISERPGGVVEATARPGIDEYIVAAEGYLLDYDDVEHASPTDSSQTIRLERCGVVRARVVRDGAPVADASVTLIESRRSNGSVYLDRNHQATDVTDSDGRFVLNAPTEGLHRLQVAPRAGAPLVVDDVRVDTGGELDLGVLELLPGASIDGRVLLPPGVEPAGLTVYLGHWQDDVKTVTDAAGRFRFVELAAGANSVTVGARPGVLASGAKAEFELRAGVETPVTVDAREYGSCEVVLRLHLGGLSVSSLQVDLMRTDGTHERATLGKTDDEGVVRGFVRAWGEAQVMVYVGGMRSLVHPDARFVLTPGDKIDEVLRFELGTLRLVLPKGVALPYAGRMRLILEPEDGERRTETLHISFAQGEPSRDETFTTTVLGGVELRAVPSGRWNVRVVLEENDAPTVEVQVGNGIRFERLPYFTGAALLYLRGGETVELRL